MSNITELIKNIRNSIYGNDVRESIAGAIEQCYEDASKNGNANMEVTEARGTFSTLNNRLNNSDSVKANRTELETTKSNLQNQIDSLASGSPKGNYATVDALVTANPETGVYVVTENGHIYSWTKDAGSAIDLGVYQATEIADNSINYKKVTDNLLLKQNLKYSPSYYNAQKFLQNKDLALEYGSVVGNNGNNNYSDNKTVRTRTYFKTSGKVLFIPNNKNISFGIITTKLISKPDNIYVFNSSDFKVGSIDGTTGNITNNKVSYKTEDFIVFPTSVHLRVDSHLFEFAVFYYDSEGTYLNNSGWVNDLTIDPSQSTNQYKIVIRELNGQNNIMTEDFKTQFFNDVSNIWLSNEPATTSGWLSSNYYVDFDMTKIYRIIIRTSTDAFNIDSFDIVDHLLIADNVTEDEIAKLKQNVEDIEEEIKEIKEYGLNGKVITVIGDSISSKIDRNACEIEITEEDVGKEFTAYLTYYDVQAGLSLGGHTFTEDEIGEKITFIPTNNDVGKKIGLAKNYNDSSIKTWWELLEENNKCIVNPVCWSGASITSHEADIEEYKTSYAWHDAQIRKVGIRIPGSMNRKAPDIIIIYRGTNDFSHVKYAELSMDTFNNINYSYPITDVINENKYGYKEGLVLLVSKLRENYPSSKIYLCTLNVFKRVHYEHFPTNNGLNTLPQYNNAIREVANFMGCGLIEFDKDGITFENCYTEGYITDSPTTPTHPSNKGHILMYNKALTDLIKN